MNIETHRANYPRSTLTEQELNFLEHVNMFGSDAYPVRKAAGKWFFDSMFGAGGTPLAYKTKRAANEAVETYLGVLRDKMAGRWS